MKPNLEFGLLLLLELEVVQLTLAVLHGLDEPLQLLRTGHRLLCLHTPGETV